MYVITAAPVAGLTPRQKNVSSNTSGPARCMSALWSEWGSRRGNACKQMRVSVGLRDVEPISAFTRMSGLENNAARRYIHNAGQRGARELRSASRRDVFGIARNPQRSDI